MKKSQGSLFLFFIDNEELKRERKYALLVLNVGFMLYSLFFSVWTVVTLWFFAVTFHISAFEIITFFVLGILWRGMWGIQLWAYLALFIITFIYFFIPDSPDFSLTIFWFLFFLVISAWRVRSFLKRKERDLEPSRLFYYS